jgi:hypothetical protein
MATSSEWTTEQLVEKFGQFWSSRDGDGESEVADETTRTGSVNDRDSSLPCLGYINLDEEVKMRGEDFGEDLDFQTLVTEMEGEINGQKDQIVKFQTTKLAINKADMVWLFERFPKLETLIVPVSDFHLSALQKTTTESAISFGALSSDQAAASQESSVAATSEVQADIPRPATSKESLDLSSNPQNLRTVSRTSNISSTLCTRSGSRNVLNRTLQKPSDKAVPASQTFHDESSTSGSAAVEHLKSQSRQGHPVIRHLSKKRTKRLANSDLNTPGITPSKRHSHDTGLSASRRGTPGGNLNLHVKRFILDTSDVSKIQEATARLADLKIEQGFHDSGQLGAMVQIDDRPNFLRTVFICCDISDCTINALKSAPYLSTITIDAENVDVNWFLTGWNSFISVHLYKYFHKTTIEQPQHLSGPSSLVQGAASCSAAGSARTTLRTLEINCCNEAGDEFSCLEQFELTNLYLRNASTLRPTQLSPLFNPVVLQRLDVSYTRAAEDDLLRLLVEQKVALRVLVAVIAPPESHDSCNNLKGFNKQVLTAYLEWPENTKLEVLEIAGHVKINDTIFRANMACIRSLRYFGCLFTGCLFITGENSSLGVLAFKRQQSIMQEEPTRRQTRAAAQRQLLADAIPLPSLTVKLTGPQTLSPCTTVDPTLIIEHDPSGPTAGQFYRVSDQIKASNYVKP